MNHRARIKQNLVKISLKTALSLVLCFAIRSYMHFVLCIGRCGVCDPLICSHFQVLTIVDSR